MTNNLETTGSKLHTKTIRLDMPKKKKARYYLLTGSTDILLAISNNSLLDSLSLTT